MCGYVDSIDSGCLASGVLHVKGMEYYVFVVVIVRALAEGSLEVVGGDASQPLVVTIAAAKLEHSLAQSSMDLETCWKCIGSNGMEKKKNAGLAT